jgi:hypothetical protein
MGRLWGVLWGAVVILGSACADVSSGAPRTPNGMLWAGTTFQLRASATVNNLLVTQSGVAQVQVGQVVRWQWQVESPNGLSVSQGTDAVFQVRLINDGNGWDSLTFTLEREELENRRNWTIELRETQRWGRLVIDNSGNGGAGSVIRPGDEMLYLVCARTPGWNVPTDGVHMRLAARATGATQAQILGEFVAGVRRDDSIRTRAWSYGDHTNLVPAVLYHGRLFWMGTNPNTNETRIFRLRDAVEAPEGGGLGSERLVYGRPLRNFRPTGFSVVLGDGWFTGLGNQLIRIDLPRVVANNMSSDPYQIVQFPPGVQPRMELTPLVSNGRLYVAGSDRRLHAISPDGVRIGQSALLPPNYGAFSTNLVQIGRVFYIGTDQGWVVQFDALTGALRTARRVSMQPIHSLAPAFMGRALLVRAGPRELYALHPSQMSVQWRRAFTEDLVSPVVASSQGEVGAVVDKQGRLFAFHTRFGFNLPLYPQTLFGDQQLSSASVAIVRRADRQVGYVYVLGQLAREETNPQALFRIVTLENPLNRLEFGESTLHVGSRYHPTILITGAQQNSYCLLTAFRAESYGGTVAGIPLR